MHGRSIRSGAPDRALPEAEADRLRAALAACETGRDALDASATEARRIADGEIVEIMCLSVV